MARSAIAEVRFRNRLAQSGELHKYRGHSRRIPLSPVQLSKEPEPPPNNLPKEKMKPKIIRPHIFRTRPAGTLQVAR